MSAPASSAVRFCLWWGRCYTAGLPPEVGERRLGELVSDLYEHAADAHPHPVGAAMVGRTVRGMADDLLWRWKEGRAMSATSSPLRTAWAAVTQAWFAPLAGVLGLFNLLFAGAIAFDSEANDPPGQYVGPLIVLALTAIMCLGLHRRRLVAARPAPDTIRPAGRWSTGSASLLLFAAATVLAVGAAGAFYLAIGLGLAMAVLGIALVRWRRRTGPVRTGWSDAGLRADLMLLAGTVPAFAMWWLIVPPIFALVLVGGVLGTRRGTVAPQPV